MLNLYLAPRSRRAPVPEDAAVDAAIRFLQENGVIGEAASPDEYPPGRDVANLFPSDADDHLLPAELTFEAWHVHRARRATFLPELPQADGFPGATCTICGDEIDPAGLAEALGRLDVFPVHRFTYTCPSCRTELELRDIDFGQPTALARFWFLIEGAAFSRLTPALLERLGKVLGTPLQVVPERPVEHVEDWVPARRRRP